MIKERLVLYFLITSGLFVGVNMQDEDGEILNPIRFPFGGPFMGIFAALSIPLGLKEEDVFVSYNLEANYVLPENQTTLLYPPILEGRSITRLSVFNLIQRKLSNMGYPGYECVLRLICDVAVHPIKFFNGVLGDLLHILLTPSSSIDPDLPREYQKAENYGLQKGNCMKYNAGCPYSVIDFFSIFMT